MSEKSLILAVPKDQKHCYCTSFFCVKKQAVNSRKFVLSSTMSFGKVGMRQPYFINFIAYNFYVKLYTIKLKNYILCQKT